MTPAVLDGKVHSCPPSNFRYVKFVRDPDLFEGVPRDAPT